MRLKITRLGKIRNLDIEVRPITFFVGDNGTGKTWTTYIFAALASSFSRERKARLDAAWFDSVKSYTSGAASELMDFVLNASSQQNVSIEIDKHAIYSLFPDEVTVTMNFDELEKYTGMDIDKDTRASLTVKKNEFLIYKSRAKKYTVFAQRIRSAAFITIYAGETFIDQIYLAASQLTENRRKTTEKLIANTISHAFLRIFNSVYPFPAERKALLMLYPLLGAMSTQAMSSSDSGDDSLPNTMVLLRKFSNRPSSFAKFMSMMEFSTLSMQQSDKGFQKLSKILENDIISAQLNTSISPDGNDILQAHIAGLGSIELESVHSLVRSLGGLDMYLKTLANKDDLIILDEPEMNAHPEAQVRLTELFGIMANSGIRLMITTHSPYIIDHMNNLVEAGKVSKGSKGKVSEKFKLKTEDAFLKKSQVAVYLIKNDGVLVDIYSSKDDYIDWKTFSSVSEYLNSLFGDIIREQ